jgi:glucose-6-phosphate 1-dehydrogenase
MKHTTPVTVVIFGGTGDLAEQKLLPALSDLYAADCLPDQFFVVGFSRKDLSDDEYQQFIATSLDKKGKPAPESFTKKGRYKQGDLTNLDSYRALATYLHDLDETIGVCTNKLFYLAVPPTLYEAVFTNLAASGLAMPCKAHARDDAWTRLLVEKPFGDDEQHAKHLDMRLGSLFTEEQVFRIDHYVAKETLQNILTFRFANTMFEPLWNADVIERVEIDMFESFDIKKRGAFYNAVGALKDVGQNHMLQMLALIAMDKPTALDASSIRDARAEVLKHVSLHGSTEASVIRGQYNGYLETAGVAPGSTTETFVNAKLSIDTPRWKGVPFYIRTGKALNETATRITVTFKAHLEDLFLSQKSQTDAHREYKNSITFAIQPNEGITVKFWVKRPGFVYELEQKELSFSYPLHETRLPDAYERVLYDALRGDQTLFISTEEVMAQWRLIMQIIDQWTVLPLHIYERGVHADTIGGTI